LLQNWLFYFLCISKFLPQPQIRLDSNLLFQPCSANLETQDTIWVLISISAFANINWFVADFKRQTTVPESAEWETLLLEIRSMEIELGDTFFC
jgi:hypothetical protein